MVVNNKTGKQKSISKVIIWQVLGSFLLQGIGFFTTPIFTRILLPSDYGQTSTFSSWVSIVGIFIGLQLSGTIGIAKNKIKEDEYNQYCSSVLGLATCAFLVVQLLLLALQSPISVLMKFPSWLVPVIALQSYATFVISFFATKLEFEFKVEIKTIISAVLSLVTIALSLMLAVHMESNRYVSKILGALIPAVSLAIIEVFVVFSKGKTFFSKKYWRFALGLSIPLMFHAAAGIVFAQSDIIMLKSIVDESETGIYSLVYSLAIIIDLLWSAFNHSWIPFYYEYKKDGKFYLIEQKSKGYRFIFTSITIGFMLCAPEVFKILVPEQYWSGLKIVPLVACTYYFNFLYSFPANHEFFYENTKLISTATVMSAILNIVINLLLIPRYHSIGAAIATLMSYFLVFAFHDYCARYIIGDFEYTWRFYIVGLIPVILAVVLYYFIMPFVLLRWAMAVLLGIIILLRVYIKQSVF